MSETKRNGPSRAVLREAIDLAVRAPSIHNTQPWRWRIKPDTIDLYVDPTRQLTIADPGRRALLVSCGAALFQACLGLAAAGWRYSVTRQPNPFNDDHLATVLVTGEAPVSEQTRRLAAAARRRRTDRRPFTDRPIDVDVVRALTEAAAAEGALLRQITDAEDRLVLAVATGRADELEEADPAYVAELGRWTGKPEDAADGVPSSAVPHIPDRRSDVELRNFEMTAAGTLPVSAPNRAEHAVMFVLATAAADVREQLRAGEALARVLLTATELGLAISPYTQPLEVPGPRRLMHRVLGEAGEPQLALRVGWPGPGPLPPLTPRRPLTDVVEDEFTNSGRRN